MTEYIEREALKILFAGACAECRDSCAEFDGIEADCNQCLLNGVIKDAKSIPAADVRPVVTCGECKHWETDWKPRGASDGIHYCMMVDLCPSADWFCADGEKREES